MNVHQKNAKSACLSANIDHNVDLEPTQGFEKCTKDGKDRISLSQKTSCKCEMDSLVYHSCSVLNVSHLTFFCMF